MARYPLTGSRVSLSASTRVREMHRKGETTAISSWQSRSWKSWRGLWMASSDSWCQSMIPRGSTDAIFVVRQLQEKYLAANKRLYMAFVDLEKAFDQVPWKVIWWALRKLGVEEWIVWMVQGVYASVWSRVHVGQGYSEEFEVKVSVHQGSVLSLQLFIIVLEALSCEFHSVVPWEDLYANDFVIITESLEECVRRLLTWKEAMEEKGLRVMQERRRPCSVVWAWTSCRVQVSPCAVCCSAVGSNSIFCNGCKHCVHKKCSGLKRLTKDPDCWCTWC